MVVNVFENVHFVTLSDIICAEFTYSFVKHSVNFSAAWRNSLVAVICTGIDSENLEPVRCS